ncbi:MAG TPA: HAMP domain-containing sensor histidine kinase [Nocardioidaceae bacterium]|nr:HAMP domain-containing sensor histidine kinase [Nocardioidaceae bacterium]
MRERLVAGFVGLAVVCVVVFAISRVFTVLQVVPRNLEQTLDGTAALIAAVVADRESTGQPVTADYLGELLNDSEHVVLVQPGEERIEAGASIDPELKNLVVSEPVDGGGKVTLTLSGEVLDEAVAARILPVATVGVSLILFAALVGLVLARRMSRPFRELAGYADEFGRGRFDVDIPHYSIPEAEEIAVAMREAAAEVSELVRREREFAANASHQLRTPITAMRLELEDLTMWPDTPPPVRTQLDRAVQEVDRLSSTVDELLDLARGRRVDTLIDINLSAVVADVVERWRPRAGAAGRSIEYDGRRPVAVRLAAGPISQVLDALVENAVKHGTGTITVSVAEPDHYVTISVRDQGRRTIDNDIFTRHVRGEHSQGHGIGLAVATEMAEAIGGHLALDPDERTTFSLMLPRS